MDNYFSLKQSQGKEIKKNKKLDYADIRRAQLTTTNQPVASARIRKAIKSDFLYPTVADIFYD